MQCSHSAEQLSRSSIFYWFSAVNLIFYDRTEINPAGKGWKRRNINSAGGLTEGWCSLLSCPLSLSPCSVTLGVIFPVFDLKLCPYFCIWLMAFHKNQPILTWCVSCLKAESWLFFCAFGSICHYIFSTPEDSCAQKCYRPIWTSSSTSYNQEAVHSEAQRNRVALESCLFL